METKPTKESFSVEKVRLTKTGGLRVKYNVVMKEEDTTYVSKHEVEMPQEIHRDLRRMLDNLTSYIYDVLNYETMVSDISEPARIETDENKDAVFSQISIKGFARSGKGLNEGIIINGIVTYADTLKTEISTARLPISQERDDITFAELGYLIDDIEEEIYAYIFEGKQAELETF